MPMQSMHHAGLALACAFALPALLAVQPALAHADHAHHQASAVGTGRGFVDVKLTDAALVDQSGRSRKLKSDVLADRVTVVNFVYTTCTTICPVSSALFAELQERLGAQLGKEVQLLSISVDPQRDTPSQLRAYASKVGARAGWTWLTGRKDAVDGVLKSFGAYNTRPEDHPPMLMIGDAHSGKWTRLYGFPSVSDVLAEVNQRVADCAAAAAKQPQ